MNIEQITKEKYNHKYKSRLAFLTIICIYKEDEEDPIESRISNILKMFNTAKQIIFPVKPIKLTNFMVDNKYYIKDSFFMYHFYNKDTNKLEILIKFQYNVYLVKFTIKDYYLLYNIIMNKYFALNLNMYGKDYAK